MNSEREIDALLSRDETGSIIDRLMALPRPAANDRQTTEWDRAVAGRFEAHLARQMRALIGSDDERRPAA
ncbi:hypothetical protein [Mesorhizobium sp. SP-1A]|jgi:hypothetical protein|uniref:hypothetical protein n=1 Tax=Mesorhizobium sp. SP-1A TaxID=3077840 RepID=UPI0028F7218E|nr:hypothetical protein [Mesorhizobium sp. SP-1A]